MGLFSRRPSEADLRQAAAIAAIRAAAGPATGVHRVAVMCPKGGVGKTVTAAGLAHQLAEYRGEIVAAIDGNAHTGTLRRRLVPATVPPRGAALDLAALGMAGQARADWVWLAGWHDLVGRLRLFSNAALDPARVEAMTAAEYSALVQVVSWSAQIVVQDMGTSITGPVAQETLALTDTLVVATDLTQDTLEMTIEFISALAGRPQAYTDHADFSGIDDGRFAHLVPRIIVAVGPSRDKGRDPIDMEPLLEWLRAAAAAVVMVPFDKHLATGDLIDFDSLGPAVTTAHLELAALVAAQFSAGPAAPAAAQAPGVPAMAAHEAAPAPEWWR